MKKINRRQFLQTAGLGTLASMGGIQMGFGSQLFGTRGLTNGRDILVYVFLYGGMDGLNLLPPRTGTHAANYQDLRPSIQVPNSQILPLTNSDFGFHPQADGLQALFNSGKMAIVHACGMLQANRSHFDSITYLELGTPGNKNTPTGWLTRYFESSLATPADSPIPLMVPNWNSPNSVLGSQKAVVVGSPEEFKLTAGHWAWTETSQTAMEGMYNPAGDVADRAGSLALSASATLQAVFDPNNPYVPENGAVYPTDSYFGDRLRSLAQIIKADIGMEVAYVPLGGWDTHAAQDSFADPANPGEFGGLVRELSQGLMAFYTDLSVSHAGRITIVVQSEFGRRAYENADGGTDHGYGNPLLVIGDNVNPGFFGSFPGLGAGELYEDQDVAVTTDYRQVISEILIRRTKNRFLGHVFPGFSNYTPLGVVQGQDMPPVYDFNFDNIYAAGFE